jgi:hypothetical protein
MVTLTRAADGDRRHSSMSSKVKKECGASRARKKDSVRSNLTEQGLYTPLGCTHRLVGWARPSPPSDALELGSAVGQAGAMAYGRRAHMGPNKPSLILFSIFSQFYVLELNTTLVFVLYNYGISKQC